MTFSNTILANIGATDTLPVPAPARSRSDIIYRLFTLMTALLVLGSILSL